MATTIALFLFATPWGIGVSPDSAGYLHQARMLNSGGGLAALGSQWPPIYPVILAGTAVFTDDPLVGARALNMLLFAANVALVGLFVARVSGYGWLAIAGSLLMLTAPPVLMVHAYAWSEALFFWLGFLGLFVLARYLRQAKWRSLILAAFLLALAALTRYAGLAFIISGALAIVLILQQPPWKRVLVAVIFGLLSALPLVLWLGWTLLQSGTAGNRELAFHPIGQTQVWQAVMTVTGWLHLPPATPGVVRLLVLAVLLLAAVTMAFIGWRDRDRQAMRAMHEPFVWLMALLVPIYLSFLLLTISFFDANTPLDDRILAPAYVAMLILVVAGMGIALGLAMRRRLVRGAIIGALGLVILVQLASAASWIRTYRQGGLGYSSPAWRQSETVAAVRELPEEVVIFSNAPEAIDLLAGREALALPRKNNAMLGIQNAGYENEIAAVTQAVAAGAVVVYFDALMDRPVTSASELASRTSLAPLQHTADGLIFGAERGK